MTALVGKALRVVDAQVPELRDIKHIVGGEAVGVDDAIRPDRLPHDRERRFGTGIRDDGGMDLAAPP